MQNNIFQIFNTIFSEDPKLPKSICLEIDVLDSINQNQITETQLSDIFEIYLHMFIYGFKKLNLSFDEKSILILKQYFASLDPSISFNIDIKQFETKLFKDPQYLYRYCIIDSSFIIDDQPLFISNANKFNRTKLNEYIAVYQDEYESMIFVSFDFV